jgi:hypothetical protein
LTVIASLVTAWLAAAQVYSLPVNPPALAEARAWLLDQPPPHGEPQPDTAAAAAAAKEDECTFVIHDRRLSTLHVSLYIAKILQKIDPIQAVLISAT